jgi:hypothetical protein
MSGGPGKTRQAHHDHHGSNNRPLALAAHSHTMNDFGPLEYPYRADRAQHNPDPTSHPHLLAPFSAKELTMVSSFRQPMTTREGYPSLDIRLTHQHGLTTVSGSMAGKTAFRLPLPKPLPNRAGYQGSARSGDRHRPSIPVQRDPRTVPFGLTLRSANQPPLPARPYASHKGMEHWPDRTRPSSQSRGSITLPNGPSRSEPATLAPLV